MELLYCMKIMSKISQSFKYYYINIKIILDRLLEINFDSIKSI